jgi:hypothetical protein
VEAQWIGGLEGVEWLSVNTPSQSSGDAEAWWIRATTGQRRSGDAAGQK